MSALSRPRGLRTPAARSAAAPVASRACGAAAEVAAPLRVGLLGGSFNPAHDGHRYVSLEALKRLGLDQVWWLVSPQNPLKPRLGMAPLAERVARARAVAAHPRIGVVPLESRLRTRYTVDTLRRLAAWRGDARFVWLIGADNLAQLPRWRQWRRVLETCPVAVFERHPYSYPALAGPAAAAFAVARLGDREAHRLAVTPPPAWVFVRLRPHAASATALRAGRGEGGRAIVEADGVPADHGDSGGETPGAGVLDVVRHSLEDDKAVDPVVIGLAGKTNIADHMVVATGTSQRHIAAMADKLRDRLRDAGVVTPPAEGLEEGGSPWVLIDAGEVIVHLFRAETRAFYDIEKLWSVAPPRRAAAAAAAPGGDEGGSAG